MTNFAVKKDKYYDLMIDLEDSNIYVHKVIVCEESGLISMLYRRLEETNESKWPPINTVKMELPDNVSVKDIEAAISFIYEKTDRVKNVYSAIVGLVYLMVPLDVIIEFVKNNFLKEPSEDIWICLDYLYHNYDVSVRPMIDFFNHTPSSVGYNINGFGNAIIPLKINPSMVIRQSEMFYFPKIDCTTSQFKFSGFRWRLSVNDESESHPTGTKCSIYICDLIPFIQKTEICIRATMRAYWLDKPYCVNTIKSRIVTRKIVHSDYQTQSNKIRFKFNEKGTIRISLLLEHIEKAE